jgi:hypothetical protein
VCALLLCSIRRLQPHAQLRNSNPDIRDGKLAVRALAGTLIQLSAHTKESTFIFYNLCVLYSQVASARILSHTNVINVKVLADNGSLGVN